MCFQLCGALRLSLVLTGLSLHGAMGGCLLTPPNPHSCAHGTPAPHPVLAAHEGPGGVRLCPRELSSGMIGTDWAPGVLTLRLPPKGGWAVPECWEVLKQGSKLPV